MKLSRIKNLIFLHLQRLPLKSRRIRPYIVKLGGVKYWIINQYLLGKMFVLIPIILLILK